MFFKIGVLKNFANFTGKHLCWSLSLSNKVAGLLSCSFIQNRSNRLQMFFKIRAFLKISEILEEYTCVGVFF